MKGLVPWLVAMAFFMESLGTTILNTALPKMADALRVAPLSMKSVLTSYTLSLAVFIPVSGWVADRYGTRRVFASAIGTFTLGSLLCGLSGDLHSSTFPLARSVFISSASICPTTAGSTGTAST
jgi:MFS family permease